MSNPIAFALDFPTLGRAANFIQGVNDFGQKTHESLLYSQLGAVKIGLELYISSGPRSIEVFQDFGLPVILDLKLHDIPATVERAVKAGGDLGVKYMTLHIQQRAALEAAVKAAEPFGITLLGVTVLTSMTVDDFKDLNYGDSDMEYRVIRAARFGADCGLKGFVCSPQEVASLHSRLPEAFFLVPGVRSAEAEKGDQKRTGTPRQAIQDGASMIVVGRQIRDAKDPRQAALDILEEIEE